MKIRATLLAAVLAIAAAAPAAGDDAPAARLYKSPDCGCCDAYADVLRGHGFDVAVEAVDDLFALKQRHGVPEGFEGCHTLLIDGYVVEGHVPVAVLNRLLAERPGVAGISLPGMPEGSPGMTGVKAEPFVVHSFGGDRTQVYAVE